MTCDEFKKLCNKSPTEATTGERVAYYKHVSECASCAKWLRASIPPVVVLPTKYVVELQNQIDKDMEDPEVQKIMKEIHGD